MKSHVSLLILFIIFLIDVAFCAHLKDKINEEVKQTGKNETIDYNININFTYYNRLSEINSYLDRLSRDYPNKMKIKLADKTSNGNDLKIVEISATNLRDQNKPVIIITGGMHAREWISPAFTLYMIHKLVENITEEDVVENLDWIIIPVLNPDGYEFTHSDYNDTSVRLWRKNRSKSSNSQCLGVDLNRNFDDHWMPFNDSCSRFYSGDTPFSEIETRVLKNVFAKYKGRAKGFLDIHSYGSNILYPWSCEGVAPLNGDELDYLAKKMVKAISELQEPNSVQYIAGNAAKTTYPMCGSSIDYAMSFGNITLPYLVELPSGGNYGFDLPTSKIQQVVTETWAGVLAYARHIIDKFK